MKNAWLILFTLSASPVFADSEMSSKLTESANKKVQQFAKQLKSTLQAGVKQGGLTQGVNVCNGAAPVIAKTHSTHGWQVGRTSLKVRNENNQADEWERQQLIAFEQKYRQGASAKELSVSEIVETTSGERYFRFMKAIPTQALCLKCHGSNIDPKVVNQIAQHYPNDQATGFSVDDLRGAFTLTKKLSD